MVRARREMQLALNAQNAIEVAGPRVEWAVVAYARVHDDRIAYEIPRSARVFQSDVGLDRSSFVTR